MDYQILYVKSTDSFSIIEKSSISYGKWYVYLEGLDEDKAEELVNALNRSHND